MTFKGRLEIAEATIKDNIFKREYQMGKQWDLRKTHLKICAIAKRNGLLLTL